MKKYKGNKKAGILGQLGWGQNPKGNKKSGWGKRGSGNVVQGKGTTSVEGTANSRSVAAVATWRSTEGQQNQ